MEDQDPSTDVFIRLDALDRALSLYAIFHPATMPSADVVLNDIMHVSNEFYTFLKGDTE